MPGPPSLEFQTLFEAPDPPRSELPETLERIYGGFGLTDSVVFANLVSSIDGIVAIPGVERSSALISGGSRADRFVVAMLRAAADAVVIGAGTFRAHQGPWTAENAYPDAADQLLGIRGGAEAGRRPTLVVVTASGDISKPPPAGQSTMFLTTAEGARRLEGSAGGAEIVEVGESGPVGIRGGIEALRLRGFERILTEGGPSLMGDFLDADAVDELFLTVSPVIVGGGETARPTLASGVDLLGAGLTGRLLSVRRSDHHLFLHYLLRTPDA